uniref:Uncharacterized protein n=1 Tax=Arundo donax TaxID=35708 RepID=A0A0A9FIE6_ARUDO
MGTVVLHFSRDTWIFSIKRIYTCYTILYTSGLI